MSWALREGLLRLSHVIGQLTGLKGKGSVGIMFMIHEKLLILGD